MQTFFSNIGNSLYDWFLLIGNSSLYSAILAAMVGIILSGIFVGLVMSARCRAKNSQLRRALTDEASSKGLEDITLVDDLEEAKHSIQNLEEELHDKDKQVTQMEIDMKNVKTQAEYAVDLEQHINHRNEQILHVVDTLETDFDMAESQQPPSLDDVWAEALWQRHSELMTHLQSRLHATAPVQKEVNNQQSFADLAKKESIIKELKQILETQSSQISQLEHDLEEQKCAIKEDLLKSQAHNSELGEKQDETLARIADLENELLEARKSALEKVIVKVQHIPSQVLSEFDEIAFKPFTEQVARIKETASKQSQQAINTFNNHVISPAMTAYHTFSDSFTELPKSSMDTLQKVLLEPTFNQVGKYTVVFNEQLQHWIDALRRQGEELKKMFVRIKEQGYDSETVGRIVAAVKQRFSASPNLQSAAEA